MTQVTVGTHVPDFELPDQDGGIVKLSALSGKPVVVFIYPQDGTGTCTAEAVSFSALAGAFAAGGVALYGLSPDPAEKHRRFRRKHALDVPLLCDPDRLVIERWGCWGEKVLFGRRYQGVIRSTFLIDGGGRFAAIWRNVRVAGHAEEVLRAALALAAGTKPAA